VCVAAASAQVPDQMLSAGQKTAAACWLCVSSVPTISSGNPKTQTGTIPMARALVYPVRSSVDNVWLAWCPALP